MTEQNTQNIPTGSDTLSDEGTMGVRGLRERLGVPERVAPFDLLMKHQTSIMNELFATQKEVVPVHYQTDFPENDTQGSWKKIVVIIYTAGECGGYMLENILKHYRVPHFLIHNMDEFFKKFCLKYMKHVSPPPVFDLLDVTRFLKVVFHHVLVVDIYRTPIERKMCSFFRRLKWNLQTFVWEHHAWEKWKKTTLEEKINIFDNKIYPNIEKRNGLDTEFPNHHFLRIPFQHKHKTVFTDCPSCPKTFFLKMRYQDRKHWFAILRFYLNRKDILEMEEEDYTHHPKLDLSEENRVEYEYFKTQYFLSDKMKSRLFFDPLFQKYTSQAEQEQILGASATHIKDFLNRSSDLLPHIVQEYRDKMTY